MHGPHVLEAPRPGASIDGSPAGVPLSYLGARREHEAFRAGQNTNALAVEGPGLELDSLSLM